jgi:homopolymeric O-antigen transport system permease protein
MFPTRRDLHLAVADLRQGWAAMPLWGTLGWQDIRQRYRRSTIGPFWITIGMALNIAAIGLVWGTLFKFDRAEFIPYLTIGALMWFLITDTMREGAVCFISMAPLIKQMRRPYSIYLYLVIWRNFLIFAHNFIIFIAVALIFLVVPSWSILLLPLGMLVVLASTAWAALLFGTISARFRDVPLVVSNLLAVLFFLTPVMWKASQLGRAAYIADLNPLTHYIALVREPLIGGHAPALSWIVAIAITIVGWTITFLFFARFRSRIAYWL